jgi:excinuclease UvrABC nuclease subunit
VWGAVPNEPGVYVICDQDEVVYVGMAGRNGNGGVRNRLRDHASGQIVNMFAQYLFLARVQFLGQERINHPRAAKQACRDYISERCSFRYLVTKNSDEARAMEIHLKHELRPSLNP